MIIKKINFINKIYKKIVLFVEYLFSAFPTRILYYNTIVTNARTRQVTKLSLHFHRAVISLNREEKTSKNKYPTNRN